MPPSPALILRVGVTGHRPNKLTAEDRSRLRRETDDILARLKSAMQTVAPDDSRCTLQVVSPLAEGADRIVAESAQALGAELVVPLPFRRDAYAQDFTEPESRAEYERYLEQAVEVVELDGDYSDDTSRNAAYARVGALVVEQSDVILALWDGEKAAGVGGTAEIVALAQESKVPVLWLPTSAAAPAGEPKAPRLILPDDTVSEDAVDALMAVVVASLMRRP